MPGPGTGPATAVPARSVLPAQTLREGLRLPGPYAASGGLQRDPESCLTSYYAAPRPIAHMDGPASTPYRRMLGFASYEGLH